MNNEQPDVATAVPPLQKWRRKGMWAITFVAAAVMGWNGHDVIGVLRDDSPPPTNPPPTARVEPPHQLLIKSMRVYADREHVIAVPAGARLTAEQEHYLTGASPLPEIDDARNVQLQLIRTVGAAPIRRTTLILHLDTLRKQTVTITDIRPVEIIRGPALGGTLLDYTTPILPVLPGAEEVPLDPLWDDMDVIFDFERPQPIALTPREVDHPLELPAYFPRTRLRINNGASDDERMLVIRSVLGDGRSSVTFKLDIEYRVGGAIRHLIIDDNGRPFRLTGIHCTRKGYASYQRANGYLPIEGNSASPNPDSLPYSDCSTKGGER